MWTVKPFRLLLAVVMLFPLLCSCSKSDDPDEPTPVDPDPIVDPTPTPTPDPKVDYTAFVAFVEKCIADGDHCKQFTASDSEFAINTVAGQSASVERGSVPYFTVGDDGNWIVNGTATTVSAGYPAIRHTAPTVEVAGNGTLVINGAETGIVATDSLRCIINSRKHVYLCFTSNTYTLGSEEYGIYNPELPTGKTTLNILFIGNSFTADAAEHLPGMLSASGIRNVYMARLYHGGYTLPEYHANFTSAVSARWTAVNGAKAWSGNNTYDDIPENTLTAKTWDIIVIQEHTGRSEAWSWPGVLQPAVSGLIDRFYKSQPDHKPTIVYLMSQTYSDNSTVLTKYFNNSRSLMYNTTTLVARKLMEDTGIDVIIPTGTMLENLRTSRLNNEMQLTRDTYHMDLGISRYAAACTVWETLITPCLGNKVADCPYRYSVSSTNTTDATYSTPVTDDNAPIAQRAAHEAVLHPFEITNLSGL